MSEKLAGKIEFEKFVDELPHMGVVERNTSTNLRIVSKRMLPYIPNNTPAYEWNIKKVIDRFRSVNTLPEKTALDYLSRLRCAVRKFIAYSQGTLSQKKQKSSLAKVFTLPIPLRENLMLTLNGVPTDITTEEADRISTILKCYAAHSNKH